MVGEQSPRKAAGLIGPGQTDSTKVSIGTNAPMTLGHGITVFLVLLRANYLLYILPGA